MWRLIATRVGGVPELIHDGLGLDSDGCLFEVGDTEAMARAAIALLSDPKRLHVMARTVRKTAQDHFCASRVIPLYEAYYRPILVGAE